MQRERRELVERDMVRMRIPELFYSASRSKVTIEEPKRAAILRYEERISDALERGVGLLLWGQNGVGKTAIAVILAKEACRLGHSVLFIRSADLFAFETKKAWFNEAEGVTLLERAKNVDLLVLDDLGKEHFDSAGRVLLEMEEFIRERVSRKRTIIMTTNIVPSTGFASIYPASMLAVMREAIFPVECVGSDHRDLIRAEIASLFTDKGEAEPV